MLDSLDKERLITEHICDRTRSEVFEMAESASHKRAKAKAAGASGQTEKSLSRNRRLDAATPRRATEVELSGDPRKLEKAARRLASSGRAQKVLQVPQYDMRAAARAMRQVGVAGGVKNMGGIKRRFVGAGR